MCGRFARTSIVETFAKLFGATGIENLEPSYNVAPTHSLLAARLNPEGARELTMLHWGLVSFWSKGPDSKYSMINARSDSLTTKPAYREPFKRRRCLIAADGFFEWKKEGNQKRPYFIRLRGGPSFAFAGLWDHWEADGHTPIDSCTIITCDANSLVAVIHDRMPVILPPKAYDAWLDPGTRSTDRAALLRPWPDTLTEMWPVGMAVNSPRNNDESLIRPV